MPYAKPSTDFSTRCISWTESMPDEIEFETDVTLRARVNELLACLNLPSEEECATEAELVHSQKVADEITLKITHAVHERIHIEKQLSTASFGAQIRNLKQNIAAVRRYREGSIKSKSAAKVCASKLADFDFEGYHALAQAMLGNTEPRPDAITPTFFSDLAFAHPENFVREALRYLEKMRARHKRLLKRQKTYDDFVVELVYIACKHHAGLEVEANSKNHENAVREKILPFVQDAFNLAKLLEIALVRKEPFSKDMTLADNDFKERDLKTIQRLLSQQSTNIKKLLKLRRQGKLVKVQ